MGKRIKQRAVEPVRIFLFELKLIHPQLCSTCIHNNIYMYMPISLYLKMLKI